MASGITARPRARVQGGGAFAVGRAGQPISHGLTVGSDRARGRASAAAVGRHYDAVASLLLAVLLIAWYPLAAEILRSVIALDGPAGDDWARGFGRGWIIVLLIVGPHLAGAALGLHAINAGRSRGWSVPAGLAILANLAITMLLVDVFATIGG